MKLFKLSLPKELWQYDEIQSLVIRAESIHSACYIASKTKGLGVTDDRWFSPKLVVEEITEDGDEGVVHVHFRRG
jgi:hypothetical protein